ncbi:MAG: PAS domain-containing protein, partial [Pacificimonas sp.]
MTMMDGTSAREEILDGNFDKVAVSTLPFALTVSNPNLDDNPLIYVSDAFSRMTLYDRGAAIGRNCRFLQGEQTDKRTVQRIRDAIAKKTEVNVDVFNYKADGTGFWNRLLLSPLFDEDDELAYYVGIQHPLPNEESPDARPSTEDSDEDVLREVQHRVKNHLAMIVGMIRLQSREGDAGRDYRTLARRVEALQLLYQELSDGGVARHNSDIIPLGAYITRVTNAVAHIDGRKSIRVNIHADRVDVSAQKAGQLGLILSELLTNSLQHAFANQRNGMVAVQLTVLSNDVVRLRVSDDGMGMPEGSTWPDDGGLGGRIVKGLVRDINGQLSIDSVATGTTATLDFSVGNE